MAGEKKIKLVLDADVIIHFAKAGRLHELPLILPEFQFLLLDVVKQELSVMILSMLNQMITKDNTLVEERFGASHGEILEFARLTSTDGLGLGRGESACMVYCLYHHDVLGSSNLRDIHDYCDKKGITYLTTTDFLYYAIKRGLMTKQEVDAFVKQVIDGGSRLPSVDFDTYVCSKI